MTDQQSRSVIHPVRVLATLSGLVLAAIGFGIWRLSPVMLGVYRDLGMPETWRQQVLGYLGAPYTFGGVTLLSTAAVIAVWRLPVHRAMWLTVGSVILTWIALVAAVWFYFSFTSFPATSMETVAQ